MAKNPKVSVIMPNYNRERYIGEAIESVLKQTYKIFELIIVDDGSTDNSSEVISRYKDERIRVINLGHSGFPGVVRNRGIEASTGELIAFIDSDDVWMKEKLEMQVTLLESNHELALIHTDFQEIDENGQILTPSVHKVRRNHHPETYKSSGWCFKELIANDDIVTSSVLLKREVPDKVGLFDTSLVVSEDHDLWLRIARYYQIGFIDRPLLQHREHPSSLTNTERISTIARYQAWIYLYEKTIQGNPDLYYELSTMVSQRLSRWHYRLCRGYFEKSLYNEARKHALKVIKYDPLKATRHLLFFISCLLGIPSLYHGYKRFIGSDLYEQN